MNTTQMYILNSALDGKDIYGLPTLMESEFDENDILEAKQNLIKMGYLENLGSFSNQGIKTTRQIEQYKQGKKYIVINSLYISLLNAEHGVSLYKNKLYNSYKLNYVKISNIVDYVLDKYYLEPLFLNNKSTESETFVEFLDLYNKYNLSLNNSVNIKTKQTDTDKYTDEIFFNFENNCYVYDKKDQTLCMKTIENFKNILVERLGFNG